ncbi:4-hydroxyphenylacetate 3-monooxygenase, reductase component [Conservatibacter flavescens]|uniref:4-hydroxyphenylacetate 3-monooxygenase reductase component n=1 Tax=Conservatibacter flavescens TaxID=28161 RepID=A0A2M8S5J9_9PAST|nr:4-hydroxyphenylacetate 3-monooxygenase, reductase component [Conservatibacter flavescens]PJG86416.1 4-hydroxyphenylacetate 3-monooxygenase, reductase component [Conservatibacter flavescens]
MVTQQEFRNAMAHLTAPVNIITTTGQFGTVGLTVSAVCSVTDSPPTVLMCINQSSELHDIIANNGLVCINILNSEQQELALHFANMKDSTMAERLAWDIWSINEKGLPILTEAVANLEGRIVNQHQMGSHSVFMVEIDDIQINSQAALGYFNRQFHTLPHL